MTKPILIIVFLLTTVLAFCQDSLKNKNNVKISILSLVDNAKFQYERLISKNHTIGLTASYFYIKPFTGIKIEPAFRFYFKSQAPINWYVETKFLIGFFNTKEVFNKRLYVYNANDSLIKNEILDEGFMKELTFIPIGASLKIGQQKFFGKMKRFVFDYNFGFQYFPYNYSKKVEQTEYIDTYGNKNVVETSQGGIRDAMPVNGFFWYIFGAGAILNTNISIGYNF